jgi:hypothetical protein
MKIKVKESEKFIPLWNGNTEESEPITVHYRFPTAGERDEYICALPAKFVNGEPVVEFKNDSQGLVKKLCKRIENLELDVNGKKVLIDDAAKLYGTEGVPVELVREIEGEIASASAVVDAVPLA